MNTGAIETALPTGIAGKAGSIISIPIQFASSANMAYDDALSRNVEPKKAMTYANVSAGIDAVADAISLAGWNKAKPSNHTAASNMNKLGVISTDIANEGFKWWGDGMADSLILRENNRQNTYARKYALNGLSPSEAQKQAEKDILSDGQFNLVMGAASGLTKTGIRTAQDVIEFNYYKDLLKRYGINSLAEYQYLKYDNKR